MSFHGASRPAKNADDMFPSSDGNSEKQMHSMSLQTGTQSTDVESNRSQNQYFDASASEFTSAATSRNLANNAVANPSKLDHFLAALARGETPRCADSDEEHEEEEIDFRSSHIPETIASSSVRVGGEGIFLPHQFEHMLMRQVFLPPLA